jgi:hypothetical protein
VTGPLNYTTRVPVHQTVVECQLILAAAGASSAAVHFEDGRPAGLSFTLKTPHGARAFTLPVDIPAMHQVLVKAERDGKFAQTSKGTRSHTGTGTYATREHAERVAWRVVKDWLEASLALIAAEMATITEIMLPYLHVNDGQTLWQSYRERERAAIEAGGGGGG